MTFKCSIIIQNVCSVFLCSSVCSFLIVLFVLFDRSLEKAGQRGVESSLREIWESMFHLHTTPDEETERHFESEFCFHPLSHSITYLPSNSPSSQSSVLQSTIPCLDLIHLSPPIHSLRLSITSHDFFHLWLPFFFYSGWIKDDSADRSRIHCL